MTVEPRVGGSACVTVPACRLLQCCCLLALLVCQVAEAVIMSMSPHLAIVGPPGLGAAAAGGEHTSGWKA